MRSLLLPLTFLVAATLALSRPARADDAELEAVRAAIEAADADWQAGPTAISALPREQRAALAGALPSEPPPGAGVRSYDGRGLPSQFDWRDHGGNWLSPIRYQDWCGSCWAFAALGVMEAAHNITAGDPDWDPDLSEQIVLSCSGGDCGGWYLELTMDHLLYEGTQLETCMPYQSDDGVSCGQACGDYAQHPWRIASYHWIDDSIPAMKAAILDAPIGVWMNVYEDLSYYEGGVYEHVWGGSFGGHFVVLVGWNDAEQCWIAKNSWGDWWGEDTYGVTGQRGWFRIKWGASEIGDWTRLGVEVPGCSCPDADGDGFQTSDCVDPLCLEPGDCDDADAGSHPGAAEGCDGLDNDCDGQLPWDELDEDGDGFMACEGDCDDADGGVSPGADEECGNAVDEDCDGVIDDPDECDDDDDGGDDDGGGPPPGSQFLDNERDGCQCDRAGGVVVSWLPLVPLLSWFGLRRRRG